MCQDGCISTLCRQRWMHLVAKVKIYEHTTLHKHAHTDTRWVHLLKMRHTQITDIVILHQDIQEEVVC